jgi:hypothetical protein
MLAVLGISSCRLYGLVTLAAATGSIRTVWNFLITSASYKFAVSSGWLPDTAHMVVPVCQATRMSL